MNQNRIIIGVAAVVVLVVIGVVLLTRPDPAPTATAPETATVAVPPPAASEAPEPAAPEPAAPETAASETAAFEAPAPETAASEAPEPETAASEAPAPEPETPAQVAAVPKATEAPTAAPTAAPAATTASPAATAAKPVLPSFDVVRVERSGEAVIAGRAAPGCEITLRAGDRILGEVTADQHGQWVLVLETPLAPGSYELSLESRCADGEVLLSENVVVVSVPQPQIAAKPAEPAETVAPPEPVAPAPEAAQEVDQAPEPAAAPALAADVAPATDVAPVPQDAQEVVQAPAAELPPAPEPSASEPGAQVAVAEPTAQVAPATAPVAEPAQSAMGSEQPLAVLMPRSGEGRIKVLQQSESASGGLGEGTLVLETVDYDAQGRTEVGGRAEIGSRLIVYLDDKPAAHTRAGATGIWRATLIKSIAPGLHRLRVDQLGTDGQVMARVETPFSRAEVLAALPEESAVIVQPGNSLWRISRRIYGEGVRYSVIYQANQDQIRDPDLIYPGQIFILPSTD